jgi:hypothetical protein
LIAPASGVRAGNKNVVPGSAWNALLVRLRLDADSLAAVEFKSQIGPSLGNNFSNRTEEALGSATGIWAARREGAFKPWSRPFLG